LRILVIGASGQLARSLVAVGQAAPTRVTAVGRPEVDLLLPETIAAAVDRHAPALVVNAAAYTAVDRAEDDPDLAHAINSAGAGAVASACQRRGIPIIHVSTDYVFDGRKAQPYAEIDPTAPLCVYGHSKLAGERSVAAGCQCHIILRTSWLVSPYGHNFVKTMLRMAEARSRIDVVDDQHGTPTFAPHLASCILAIGHAIARHPSAGPWGVYHAAGSGEASWCDVAREVFLNSSRLKGPSAQVLPIRAADYPRPARRPANSRLDCGKLIATFGTGLPGWRSGIAECVHALATRYQRGMGSWVIP
jgi:dTDP-4-dehydrorhamnose reductase